MMRPSTQDFREAAQRRRGQEFFDFPFRVAHGAVEGLAVAGFGAVGVEELAEDLGGGGDFEEAASRATQTQRRPKRLR